MVVDRLRAVINLDNLLHNYKLLKKLNHDKEIFAVVKADAYGHGSKECSVHLEKHGCKCFAVTVLKEAIELRSVGIKSEILIFGKTDPLNVSYLADYNLVQTVDSYEYAHKLNQYEKKIKVHLNIDTGMTRLGIFAQRFEELEKAVSEIKKISELENIEIAGIYSHFTSAESDKEFTLKQQ
ncbi:MAG: alanine racemase, partial [Candidatus Izemoplasmatales bacterium]|nr:alanine racemase [Candidatus Izemoplasmatales bacterium]